MITPSQPISFKTGISSIDEIPPEAINLMD